MEDSVVIVNESLVELLKLVEHEGVFCSPILDRYNRWVISLQEFNWPEINQLLLVEQTKVEIVEYRIKQSLIE